ncbi:MAG: DUF3782 domain-containing protein [Chloroflexota bacterium]
MAGKTWEDAAAEVWQLFKETDARFKETQAELERRFKETDAKFKETDQQLRRLEGLFGSQWGKMMEALVQPGALSLFQERGIQVRHIFPRAKSQLDGHTMEIDLLLENDAEVVVLEVKSTLKVSDVADFLADLGQFLDFFPRYRRYRVYAGVAGLDIVEDADRYAYRQGLFVVQVGGEGVVSLKNDAQFQPRDFAQTLIGKDEG